MRVRANLGGGTLDVDALTSFSGITNTNKLTINCNVGDYIVVAFYRSTGGIGVMWNGTASHQSSDFIGPTVTLATNTMMQMFKASQTTNYLYLAYSGATLTGGYTVISLS